MADKYAHLRKAMGYWYLVPEEHIEQFEEERPSIKSSRWNDKEESRQFKKKYKVYSVGNISHLGDIRIKLDV